MGNILTMIHQANGGSWTRRYDYAENSNRLQSTSLPGDDSLGPYSAQYEYDAHGNMTRMPHLPLMQWDFKDQLHASSKQVVNDDGTPEITYYVYDAGGQRVRKVTERTAPAGETPTRMKERIYLGGFEIYREYNGDGSTVTLERETLHIMDDQQRIALVETKTIDMGDGINPPTSLLTPILRYQLSNHLGSASLELDADGAVLSYEEYHPYGTTAYQSGRSAAEVSLKRYRYTGKERDDETGLGYHRARYYASWLGRWTATDPSGLHDSVNLFSYVTGNPIILHDPNGRSGKKGIGGVRFSPESQISPQQMVNMIRNNEKLKTWMKELFIAENDRILLNPKKVKVTKNNKNEFQITLLNIQVNVPEWFKNALLAVIYEEWYLSTGVSFVSDESIFALKGDIDKPSETFKKMPQKKRMKLN